MSAPTPKQKITITIYVTVLVLVIGMFWIYFFKKELSNNLVNSSKINISKSFESLGNIFSQSKETINQFKESYSNIQALDEAAKQNLATIALEKLEALRINDLVTWENDDLILLYPSTWFITEKAGIITISSYDQNELLRPETKATLTLTNEANPSDLSVQEWILILESNNLAYSVETLKIDEITSLKHLLTYPETNMEVISYLVPRENVMLVIKGEVIGSDRENLKNIINDIISLLKFK